MSVWQNVTASQMAVYASVAVGSQTNNSSAYFDYSIWAGIYTNSASTLNSLSTGSTASWVSWNTNATTGVGGLREFTLPLNVNMTPGHYFVALALSTTNSATGGANSTALGNTMTMYGGNLVGSAVNPAAFGVATNNTTALYSGMGLYLTTVNSAMTQILLSGIGQTGTQAQRANFALRLRTE